MSDHSLIKQSIEELKKTFNDFQALNDQRLQEIEKHGSEFPETRAAVDKANATIQSLQTTIEELQKQQSRLIVGNSQESKDETRLAAQMFFNAMRGGEQERQVSDDELTAYGEYKNAFKALIRRGGNNGHALPATLQNALQVGNDPAGGFWVPTENLNRMVTRIFDTSPMRQIADSVTIGTDSVEFPNDVNEGVSGGWVGETQARTETATPEIGAQRIDVHEQYAEPRLSQKFLDDANNNPEQWIEDKTTAKISRDENLAFVSGNGIAKPRGFLSYAAASVTTADASRAWGVLQYIAVGAAGAFPTVSGITAHDPDAFIDVVTALHPTYRQGANWVMNRSTEAAVRKLKDAEGNYLIRMGDIEGAIGFRLFGFPVVNFEDMPDIASDSYSIALGNFQRGYLVVDRIGFRLLRDPYTAKPWVKFYITKRTGGDVRNFDAIKLLKFAAS